MNEDFDNLIINQATNNIGNLEIAFKTHQLWQDIFDRLVKVFFEELEIQLLATLPKIGGDWTITRTKPANMRTAMNIHLSNSKWQNVVFGIGDYDGDRVHFFVRSQKEDKKALYEFVESHLNGHVIPDIWYQKADKPYNTWNSTIEGVMAVYQSKQFIDYSTSRLAELATYINEYLNPA